MNRVSNEESLAAEYALLVEQIGGEGSQARRLVTVGRGPAMPEPQQAHQRQIATLHRQQPQSGRQRQFTQVGAEALGSDDPALDAELIALKPNLVASLLNGANGRRLLRGRW